MNKLSRRVIARHICEQLLDGAKPEHLARLALAELDATGRRNQWQMLLDDVAYEFERRKLFARARVVSAHELSEDMRRQFERFFAKLSAAQQTDLTYISDEALVGGFQLRSATFAIDTSIKKQLNRLRKA